MEPTLTDGRSIPAKHAGQRRRFGRIFVVRTYDGLVVKRAARKPPRRHSAARQRQRQPEQAGLADRPSARSRPGDRRDSSSRPRARCVQATSEALHRCPRYPGARPAPSRQNPIAVARHRMPRVSTRPATPPATASPARLQLPAGPPRPPSPSRQRPPPPPPTTVALPLWRPVFLAATRLNSTPIPRESSPPSSHDGGRRPLATTLRHHPAPALLRYSPQRW